ncbi:gliding motility-associated C-terminal domain-containing protein, partial [Flavobacterium yafengii]|uniref:T9SS type B sorting domain-containing protein n=1 Tax=Flavobacterium yafengii TaxID=3041253 RepID=UPI0024A814FA
TPVTVNPNGTLSVSGTAEAGSTVTVTFPDGSTGTAIADAAGNYGPVTSLTPQTSGTITANATDTTGNVSPATTVSSADTEKLSFKFVKTGVLNDLNSDGFAEIGETITYSFDITNTGNVPLTNVMVTDPLLGIVMTGAPISLAIGETNTTEFKGVYILTKEDMIRGSVTNQATVVGISPSGVIVTDKSSDSSNLDDKPTVLPISGCVIEVFNAVSPNGDGDNDVFYIRGLECYPDNSVEIYNRWGVLVFERTAYNNDDRAFRGVSEGKVTVNQSEELPTGTYFYILKYKDSESNGHEKAGYLYINR